MSLTTFWSPSSAMMPAKIGLARLVPPTEMTFGEADGYCAGNPLSPDETKKLTPDCAKCKSYDDSPPNSEPPQLFETYWA